MRRTLLLALVVALAATRLAVAQVPADAGRDAQPQAEPRPAPATPAADAGAAPLADAQAPADPAAANAEVVGPAPGADAGAADAQAPGPGAPTPPPLPDAAGASAQAAPAPDPARTIAVVDAAPVGVDPAAATFVTDVLRQRATELGYTPVPTPQLYDAARRLQLPFPVPAEGLHALARALDAAMAITAEVRASGGYYQVVVRARLVAEASERTRYVVASQWTLGDSLRALVPVLLAEGQPAAPSWLEPNAPLLPDMSGVGPPPRRRPVRLHPQPWEIAGGLELAIGPGLDPFFNVLAYGRVAYFLQDRIGLTASLAYANLRGRTRRVSNALPMVGIETAVEVMPRQRIYMPLRAEIGYLPLNGVVLRGTAGLAFSPSRDVRVEFDILTPTVWVLPEVTPVTLNLGVQVIYGIGGPERRRRRRRRPRQPAAETAPAAGAETPAEAQPTGGAAPPRTPHPTDASPGGAGTSADEDGDGD